MIMEAAEWEEWECIKKSKKKTGIPVFFSLIIHKTPGIDQIPAVIDHLIRS